MENIKFFIVVVFFFCTNLLVVACVLKLPLNIVLRAVYSVLSILLKPQNCRDENFTDTHDASN